MESEQIRADGRSRVSPPRFNHSAERVFLSVALALICLIDAPDV